MAAGNPKSSAPTGKRPTAKLAAGTAKKLAKMELAARDAAVRAKLNARVAAYDKDNEEKGIGRPTGAVCGGSWLRYAMGLANNVQLYRRCQITVRRCVDKAGLDETKSFREQDTAKLVNVYRVAKELQPFLKRFRKDWATAEYIKMLLRNRSIYNARREREELPVDEDLMDLDLQELNIF